MQSEELRVRWGTNPNRAREVEASGRIQLTGGRGVPCTKIWVAGGKPESCFELDGTNPNPNE